MTHHPRGSKTKALLSWVLAAVRGSLPAIFALVDQAVVSATTLFVGVLVARGTSVEEFGSFTLVLALLIWATGMHGALVTTPYMYQWRKHAEAQQQVYQGSVLLQHVLLVLVVGVAIFFLGEIGVVSGWDGAVGLPGPLFVVFAGTLTRAYARLTAYAHELYSHALRLDLGVSILQVGTLLVLATIGDLTLPLVFLAVGVPQLALSLISLWARLVPFRISLSHARSAAADHWVFGRWLLAGVTVNGMTRDAYPWLLATIFGVAAAGVYASHANVAFLAGPAVIGLANYLAPLFAKEAISEGHATLARRADEIARVIGLLCLLYCGLLALIGGPLSALLYGEPLRANPLIITGLACSLSLVAISTPFGIGLYAIERSDINFGSSLASLVIGALLGVPLIWRLGMPGVAAMAILAALTDLIIKRASLRTLVGRGVAMSPA